MTRAPLAVLIVLLAAGHAAAETLERVAGVVHVHSDLSSGEFSLDELVARAERDGIGALLLAENYLVRIEYGLPPFRALTRVVHEEPGVGEATADYLERVRMRAASAHVLLLPGVEVIPHYWWTGTPLSLEMALHDTQKNLLVWGIEDAAALSRLPVVGNRRAGVYSLQSALDTLPVLLLVPGVLVLARTQLVGRRGARGVIVERRRRWALGLALCAIGAAAAARGWPFRTDRYSPYKYFGAEPHQALIDAVDAAGGVAVWSFPEARDSGEQPVGPVRVTWTTEPYPDDLLRTFRYTAFGALYEDTTRVERPGGEWDRMLREYAAGERSRPGWALAESGFHDASAGKTLGAIRTVFLTREHTAAAVLEAMRSGRMYALQRTPQWGLDLDELTVRAGAAAAAMGERLRVPAGTALDVRATVAATDSAAHDVRVTLVRNGTIAGVWNTTTPASVVHRDTAEATPIVYRLEVRAGTQRLLTNPVFVTP